MSRTARSLGISHRGLGADSSERDKSLSTLKRKTMSNTTSPPHTTTAHHPYIHNPQPPPPQPRRLPPRQPRPEIRQLIPSQLFRTTPPLNPNFGHRLGPKPPQHMRVILAQHNGGPRSRFHPSITDWNYKITTYQPDIILSTETGQNWRKIPPEDRWFHRVHTKRKKFKTSFNKHHMTASTELAGGTAITSLYEAFARTTQMESDPSGLGRWTSARVQGKNNTWTRAISVYRPTYNTDTLGTTYVQHLNYYRAHNRQGCPRLLILEDLRAQLADWISQGDNLIVGIDANEDVRSGDPFGQLGPQVF